MVDSLTGFTGVFVVTDGRDGVAITFVGDGVGGNTLGSFARNDLTGVLGLVRFFNGLTIDGEVLSSGNCARFRRRRTSYYQQTLKLGVETWIFRGVNPPGVTRIRWRLQVIFSSKLSSLDHPSPSTLSASGRARVKSMTRGVVGGGRLLLWKLETSESGVVGCTSLEVSFAFIFDFEVVFVDFEGDFCVLLGDRGILSPTFWLVVVLLIFGRCGISTNTHIKPRQSNIKFSFTCILSKTHTLDTSVSLNPLLSLC